MNEAARQLTARMARRTAARLRSEIEGDLARINERATAAFDEACNDDSQMAELRRSDAARRYFETVFVEQFDSYGDYRG